MRNLKCRAWDTIRKQWIDLNEGEYALDCFGELIQYRVSCGELEWDVIPAIVTVYIGTKDMKGHDIFEGDHLFAEGNHGGEDFIGTVEYCEEEAKYVVRKPNGDIMPWVPNSECWVKGNQFENKDGEENR